MNMIVIMFSDLFQSLAKYAAHSITVRQGGYLFHVEDPVSALFLVEAGELALVRDQQNGSTIVLNRVQSGAIVAEASIYSDRYHCACLGEKTSRLLCLPITGIRKHLADDRDISRAWAAYLATELQKTRARCEILSRNKVRERLAGWQAWNGPLPPKGRWKTLAAEIGVSPEALYREIKRQTKSKGG